MEYARNIRSRLDDALENYSAVLLVGARGVGKTRLVTDIAIKKGYAYISFDDLQHVIAAQDDPIGFVASLPKPVVLDNIHQVPAILPAIKQDCHQYPMPGRYLCTSRCDPVQEQSLQVLTEFAYTLCLFPFSQGELHHKKEHFIDAVFDAASLVEHDYRIVPDDVAHLMRGGFVQTFDMQPRERDVWFNRYLQHLIYNDIGRRMQVEDPLIFVRLLRVLAEQTGREANIAFVSRQSGIPVTTLNRYLAVLINLQLYVEQKAWDGNGAVCRAVKVPRSYVHDAGFAALLTGHADRSSSEQQKTLLCHAVYNELRKQMTWNKADVQLYHVRAINGHDLDMVLERSDGTVVGITITSQAQVTAQDARGLIYYKERLGKRWHRGIILYTGTERLPLANRIVLLPMQALWHYE